MKICVTGAAGRLGSFTCASVLEAGHQLVATDRYVRRDLPYPVVVADLLQREQAYPVLEGCDAVIHLGNHPTQHGRDTQCLYTENTSMNINVFQAAWEHGVQRMVFASSIQVASGGRSSGEGIPSRLAYLPLDGDAPAQLWNPYALSKDAGERLLQYYAQLSPAMSGIAIRFPGIWLRLQHRRSEIHPSRSQLDECFTFLLGEDAGRLAVAAAECELTGYRCYQAGCRDLAIDLPVAEVLARWFPEVPHKRALDLATSLVDLEPLERDLGWTPTPIEWSEAVAAHWW